MGNWQSRSDGAHEWTHDVCGEGSVFAKGVNPNKPWKTCSNCLGNMGSWQDGGVAGSGNNKPAGGWR